MTLLRILLLSLALIFQLNLLAQEGRSLDELDTYFQEARERFGITGMAIGIVKDGEIVFEKGYGLREVDKSDKVDKHTLFAIASLTKAFTAAGLALLEQEGKLNWDDPVREHLPYFALHDPYVSQLMTIEDLTCHRSGLATFDGDLLWYGTDYSRKEIVQRIRALPLKQQFRSEFGYQNIMYITAGQIIEEVGGEVWDDFMKNRLFDPIGMTATVTSIKGFTEKTNLAYPHLGKKKIDLLNYDNSGATAATNSNVSDLCKWISFWLEKNKVDGKQLINDDNRRRIFSAHTNLNVGDYQERIGVHFRTYGMGWMMMDYNGRKVMEHGGGLPGYISKIALIPEENLGFVILTNGMTSLPSALMYKIIDFYTSDSKRDWAAEYYGYMERSKQREEERAERLKAERIPNTKPTHSLKAYAGTYEDAMYGKSTLKMEEGKLKLILEPTATLFNASLTHWHYNTFQFQFADPFLPAGLITFTVGKEGAIDGFTIDLPNPDFHFYNLNFKRVSAK